MAYKTWSGLEYAFNCILPAYHCWTSDSVQYSVWLSWVSRQIICKSWALYSQNLQVKFNVNRVDNMIIQAIALLDTLDKDINTFVMRVREWYSWHFPELVKLAADNYQYSQLTLLIKDKSTLTEERLSGRPPSPLPLPLPIPVGSPYSTPLGPCPKLTMIWLWLVLLLPIPRAELLYWH